MPASRRATAQAHDPGVKLGRFPLCGGSFLMIMGHLPL
jgi:hypothetical protein